MKVLWRHLIFDPPNRQTILCKRYYHDAHTLDQLRIRVINWNRDNSGRREYWIVGDNGERLL